jgi:transposase InsO family protein
MYRLLAADAGTGGCRERRHQLIHPAYAKPELLATAPNQVWSWDITKLKGPAKWTCFHLYVILDIFSRFVVGWLIAPRECAELAQQLIVDLDVAKSHSRPHVSDDNPYSESQFKTMKYRPGFPERFGCIEDARAHCQAFFPWYNAEHCHSGIGYMTPHSVHYGLAADLRLIRERPAIPPCLSLSLG